MQPVGIDSYVFPHDYEHGPDFRRAISQIATPFQYVDIDLDVDNPNGTIFDLAGDFIYVDPDPGGFQSRGLGGVAGFAVLDLNNEQNAPVCPFFTQPGFALQAIFKNVKVRWYAQPGKKLRLMYSSGSRVVPTNAAVITGTVSVSDPGYVTYGASFANSGAQGASVPQNIFSAGSNVNGAIVYSAYSRVVSAGGIPLNTLLAKATAPTGASDGDCLMLTDSWATDAAGTISTAGGGMQKSVLVPAGKGLYWMNSGVVITSGQRSVLYTLL